MAIWLIRAGSNGEFEQKFIQDSRVYVCWRDLSVDLEDLKDKADLIACLGRLNPDAKAKALINWAGQIWPFAHSINIGDLVVLPQKTQPSIYIGEVTGKYKFQPDGPNPFFHSLPVKWVGEAIPRQNFSQDLLYSFGAFMTICRIQRNNAEARIAAMRANGWKPESIEQLTATEELSDVVGKAESDLRALAEDQIVRLISAKFVGHELTRLVNEILKAQGYTTYLSPPGADGGADILAGAGPLGFGSPRLCVQVKSDGKAVGRPEVDKLLGAMTKFGAEEGLFVSWNGFAQNAPKELATTFFRMRLWTQKDVLEQLFGNYEKLDEEIRAELPLKRVWMIAAQEEE